MKRPLSVREAASMTGKHPETIAEALRRGDLHGGQRVKGGTWSIREKCLEAWLYGKKCKHQIEGTA
ncbi:helix-turn-helix domain-containing protein [Microbacterium sp. NPDC087589]|uniref:helix-turn-helix domain-containing protein n=1 Tax=Microbacterium sp. NPDC087589 TaxID=3364191 RepID=UPI0038017586